MFVMKCGLAVAPSLRSFRTLLPCVGTRGNPLANDLRAPPRRDSSGPATLRAERHRHMSSIH